MIRQRSTLFLFLTAGALLLAACNKDELTVTSTAPPANTHTCKRVIVELNIDSLTNCDPPGPGDPDLEYTICACDTLELRPVNLPPGFDFEYWEIEQGTKHHEYGEHVLDTITAPSELSLVFHHGPQFAVH